MSGRRRAKPLVAMHRFRRTYAARVKRHRRLMEAYESVPHAIPAEHRGEGPGNGFSAVRQAGNAVAFFLHEE
jgi:hypothetical protein